MTQGTPGDGSYRHPPPFGDAERLAEFWRTVEIPDTALDELADAFKRRNDVLRSRVKDGHWDFFQDPEYESLELELAPKVRASGDPDRLHGRFFKRLFPARMERQRADYAEYRASAIEPILKRMHDRRRELERTPVPDYPAEIPAAGLRTCVRVVRMWGSAARLNNDQRQALLGESAAEGVSVRRLTERYGLDDAYLLQATEVEAEPTTADRRREMQATRDELAQVRRELRATREELNDRADDAEAAREQAAAGQRDLAEQAARNERRRARAEMFDRLSDWGDKRRDQH